MQKHFILEIEVLLMSIILKRLITSELNNLIDKTLARLLPVGLE